MIFATKKHPKRWGEVLHDNDLADAIVDRILGIEAAEFQERTRPAPRPPARRSHCARSSTTRAARDPLFDDEKQEQRADRCRFDIAA